MSKPLLLTSNCSYPCCIVLGKVISISILIVLFACLCFQRNRYTPFMAFEFTLVGLDYRKISQANQTAANRDGPESYPPTRQRPAFFQDTKTLLVTDLVVKVDDKVPDIVAQDPRPLLFHARDNALERVDNTPEVRLKGWRRIVQVCSCEPVSKWSSILDHSTPSCALSPSCLGMVLDIGS